MDVLFSSAGAVVGGRAVAAILTGMGQDGAEGMADLARTGVHTIAQDEATSTIFGMPRAAIQLGAAQEVLPPPQIAARLVELLTATNRPVAAQPLGGAL